MFRTVFTINVVEAVNVLHLVLFLCFQETLKAAKSQESRGTDSPAGRSSDVSPGKQTHPSGNPDPNSVSSRARVPDVQVESDDEAEAGQMNTRIDAKAIIRRSLERCYGKKNKSSNSPDRRSAPPDFAEKEKSQEVMDTKKEKLDKKDSSDGADGQVKKFQAHRRAYSQGMVIPPPPWERKSVDNTEKVYVASPLRRGSVDESARSVDVGDNDLTDDQYELEAAALALQEAEVQGYSPKLEGKLKGDAKAKKVKLGTKAADLFAKLQLRLSASKT